MKFYTWVSEEYNLTQDNDTYSYGENDPIFEEREKAGYEYLGLLDIDELAANNLMPSLPCDTAIYEVVEVREKALKLKDENGRFFFMPKAEMKKKKPNIYRFWEKADIDRQRWSASKRGLN